MPNTQIKRALLISSILLIFILLIISIKTKPKTYNLEELKNLAYKDNEKTIQTSGIIEKTNYNQNSISFYLKNSSIQLIIFSNKFIDLKENQQLSVIGKLNFYKNKTQVLVDEIEIIK